MAIGGRRSVGNIAAPMSAPEPEQNASEAGSGSNGAVATQSNSDATGQGVVAARSNSGGSKDRYINPDDYENSEDYAKAILEGVRNSIDAQDLDGYLTANGYTEGAEGLAALNKYVEDVLGALGVAVYTDELNAKDEEISGANGQPANSEPQEQAASSEPQAAQPASSDVPEYELYSPVEPELTPVEQIQQARWDALNRPFEQMGVPVPEWTSPENGGNGVGTDVPDDYYIKPSGYTDEDYAKELFKQLYLHNQDGTGDAFLMANGFEAGDEGKQALINDVQDRLGIENVVAYWEALNEVYGEDATQHVISAPQDDSIVPVAGGLYYNTETGEHVDNYNYEGNAENEEDSGDDNSNVNSNVNSQVEISINQIDDIMHEMFSDTYIQGSVALSDSFDPKTIEISEVAAALFNIGRGAILDLPFYLYGNALLGATKLFKVGKHATSATKTAANIMKYGASYIVGNIGSSILEEIVDMPEILKGKTTTYVVNAEFQEGNKVFQVDVNENGRIVVTYFNPR